MNISNFKLLIFIIALIYKSHINAQAGDYCKVDCKDDRHTACIDGENKCDVKCEEEHDGYTEMTDDQRLEVLDLHNNKRNKVASGAEQEGDLKDVVTENMQIISWSYEAEYIAACLAKRCKFEHDKCRNLLNNTYCGQNLASESNSDEKAKKAWAKSDGFNKMIKSWYSEVKDCKAKYYDSYPSDDEKDDDKAIGHFTQVIWALTDRIGCAYFIFKKGDMHNMHFVCNYWPGGNIISNRVFKRGDKGKDCGKDNRYPYLCGVQRPLHGNCIVSCFQVILMMVIMVFSFSFVHILNL